jgi:hypothetical protein
MSIDKSNINKVKVGKYAGYTSQGSNSIAIGINAGYTNQGDNSIAIGPNTSAINSDNSIVIGSNSASKLDISNQLVIGFDASNNSYGGIYGINLGKNDFKLGINTNNPLYDLDVSGESKLKYIRDKNNSIGNSGQVLSSTTTGIQWVTGGGGGTSYWDINGTDDIYNNNNGNVGIGTSSPAYKLDISGETRIQTTNVRIGIQTGNTNQGSYAIAIGYQAGMSNENVYAIGLGYQAGNLNQGQFAIANGALAGFRNQGQFALAIGTTAGYTYQAQYAIAIGYEAGFDEQKDESIAIGYRSGNHSQGAYSIGIGSYAGEISQGAGSIAIGNQAGRSEQGQYAIAIGYEAGFTREKSGAISIGLQAGKTNQGTNSIGIGVQAGQYEQRSNAIAIGYRTGETNQDQYTVAIGFEAGNINEKSGAIAIGFQAGSINQGTNGISLGVNAGYLNQLSGAVGIGYRAGFTGQGINSVAVGSGAGNSNQGTSAIAIGVLAGNIDQSSNAIAIGNLAGRINQAANSIIINATGTDLSSMDVSGLFIAPIRRVAGITQALYYNTTTNEIVYNDVSGSGGGGSSQWTTSGNDIYNNNSGNIGIGTTTPAYKLDVSGRTIIRDSLYMNSTDISDVSGIYFRDGTYIGHGSSFDIRSPEIIKINDNKIVINTYGAIGIGKIPIPPINYAISFNDTVYVIKYNSSNNSIYVGGDFTQVSIDDTTTNVNYICKISLGDGTVDNMNGGLDGFCYAIIFYYNDVYIGGQFTTAGGSSANSVAKWDGISWYPLGTNESNGLHNYSGPIPTCFALAINNNNRLYIGGQFDYTSDEYGDNYNAVNIVEFLISFPSFSQMGILNNICRSLVIGNNATTLYVGGDFTQITDYEITVYYIAKYETDSYQWYLLGDGLDTSCFTIDIASNGDVYAGGDFTTAGGLSANKIAKWNEISWSTLGSGLNDTCYTISIDSNDNVYAGGLFITAGGSSANRIAKWNGSSWSSLSSGLQGGDFPFCRTIEVVNAGIYAGGKFSTAGGVSTNNIAYWNGTQWYNSNLFNAGPYLMDISGNIKVSGTINDNLFIDANGNVGIGTTAPAYVLDVSGNARFSEIIDKNGSFGDIYNILTATDGFGYNWTSPSDIKVGSAAVVDTWLAISEGSSDVVYQPSNGNVGIGYEAGQAGAYKLDVNGDIRVTGQIYDANNQPKTFIIDHPVDNEKYLVHACLEGPEVGVYYRGHSHFNSNETQTTITLPPYVKAFAYDFTINITAINDDGPSIFNLSSSRINNGQFTVYRLPLLGKDTLTQISYFDWTVFAKRNDINAEPYKKDVVVKGDGPYKYI